MNQSQWMSGRFRWLLAIVLTGIAIALVAIPLSAIAVDRARNDSGPTTGSKTMSSQRQGRPMVSVAVVGSFTAPALYQSYRGVIRARRASSLAIRRAGQLVEVLVHEGDRVNKGDILALLDTSDLDVRERLADAELAAATASAAEATAGPRRQTLKSAAARVQQLQAQWEAATSTLDRQQKLLDRNAGSDQEFDDAKYAKAELKARLASATAEFDELVEGTRSEQVDAAKANQTAALASRQQVDIDRRDSRIVAPYSGVIAERMVDEGEMLSAGKPVLRIMEIDPLEAHFGVPVDTAAAWKVGDRFEVNVGDQTFEAKIARMQPQVDPLTRTRTVQMELIPEGDKSIITQVTVGQTATLLVPITAGDSKQGDAHQFWLPTEALVRGSRGLWSVYIASTSGEDPREVSGKSSTAASNQESCIDLDSKTDAVIRRREVRIVRASNQCSLVDGMIDEGELVVIDGAHRIGPGVAVQTASAIKKESIAVSDSLKSSDSPKPSDTPVTSSRTLPSSFTEKTSR